MKQRSETVLRCPHCKKIELEPSRIGKAKVDLDVCRKCKGTWFDRDEFPRVFESGASDLRCEKDARPTRWRCPRCTRALRRHTYPQTDVDILMCVDCNGVWTTPDQILTIRRQRLRLRRTGKLKTHAPVIGIKGRWVSYVNERIETLEREFSSR